MVMLKYPANINIPKKATGNPAATQNANLGRKNNDKNNITNNIPCHAFLNNNSVR